MSEHRLGEGFQTLLDRRHEAVGVRTVDDAVVEREREIRTRANADRVFAVGAGHDLDPLLQRADAENADLRLVDDRGSDHRAEYTRVRDGEGSVLHFARVETFVA